MLDQPKFEDSRLSASGPKAVIDHGSLARSERPLSPKAVGRVES